MPQHDDVVERFLVEKYGVGLEQVLLDGIGGAVPPQVAGAVQVLARERAHFLYADRGMAFHYEGALTLEGVEYRFRAWVFQDLDGARVLTDIGEFEPHVSATRMVIGEAGGPPGRRCRRCSWN